MEALGVFNPHVKENGFLPNVERIKYWLGKGAEVSGTVNNLLVSNGIMEGKKKKSVYISRTRKAKLDGKKGKKEERGIDYRNRGSGGSSGSVRPFGRGRQDGLTYFK